jgi:hypothetical protein
VRKLRRGGDPFAHEPKLVPCVECGRTLGEDEAQAVRWGYWSDGLDEVYPYCTDCARREFAPDAPRSSTSR